MSAIKHAEQIELPYDPAAALQAATKQYVDNFDSVARAAILGTNSTARGDIRTFTAGEAFVFGDVGYYKSDGGIWKADADQASTAPGIVMAVGTISANNPGPFLRRGIARLDSWSWTIGSALFLSTTAGAMTHTAPTGTDDVRQKLGICFPDADTIDWDPSIDFDTHV